MNKRYLAFLLTMFPSLFLSIGSQALAFTCDSGTLGDTCVISSTQTMDNGEMVSGAGNLVIANGGNLASNRGESFSIAMGGDITIESGGAITGNLSSATANNITIEAGAAINADAKGYASASGPGAGESANGYKAGAGGGGYGGTGGNGKTGAGETVYGSVDSPVDLGSGGGIALQYGFQGGAGGGAVKLIATGTLTLYGSITSNGGNGAGGDYDDAGGGSGGSIWIQAGTLTGAGLITANGGSGGARWNIGGGGAGGRIAVLSGSDLSTLSMQAYGGSGWQYGGAGTIFRKTAADANGSLIIDNNGHGGAATDQVVTTTVTIDNLALKNKGFYVVPESSALNIGTGFMDSDTSASITNNGLLSLPSSSTLTSVTLYNNGAINTLAELTVTSSNFYSNGTFEALTDLTVGAGSAFEFQNLTPGAPITMTSVMILDTGVLTHKANGATQDHTLNLRVTGNLDIQTGGKISVDGKGYASASGPGAGASISGYKTGAGGAGHGGEGGNGQTGSGGAVYGSLYNPVDLGSGGGIALQYGFQGGPGGGAVQLVVSGTLTLDGSITSNGGNGAGGDYDDAGGGSGGSIWIQAGTLTGAGLITANGGSGGTRWNIGGGGAGGRIALNCTNNNSTLTMQAFGGYSGRKYGGAGTVFTKAATAQYGDLKVDNNGHGGASTPQVLTSTLTIDNLALSNKGFYVVPESSTLNIGTGFMDSDASASITNNGALSLPASSTLTSVTLHNNGAIHSLQDLTLSSSNFYSNGTFEALTDLTVGAGSTFEFQNLTPSSPITLTTVTILDTGVLTHKANGASQDHILNLRVTGNMDIQTGGKISVDGKGYASACGPGAGASVSGYKAGGGGAGHGGTGGNGSTGAGGIAYDSLETPVDLGSGGGIALQYGFQGGAGGGAVQLVVSGTLTLDGSITSNGGNGTGGSYDDAGGGSGGSIWIKTGVLEGNGSIYANGGNGGPRYNVGGGGAGGRISLSAATDNSNLTKRALGGSGRNWGSLGTLFPVPPRAITAFELTNPPAAGVIDENAKTVSVSVPYGTNLSGMVPNIAITGVSVSPASGASQNFVDGVPVNYTVTAYDTSTQVYAVTVNVTPPKTIATITSETFTVSTGGSGIETITNVPAGTSLADFLAALAKGDEDQTWNASNMSDPVFSRDTLIVTAQDGATQITYTVLINLQPGDVNHDGQVTLADAMLSLQVAAGAPTPVPVYFHADVDGDNRVGLQDIDYILRESAKQP